MTTSDTLVHDPQPSIKHSSKKKKNIFNSPSIPVYLPPPHPRPQQQQQQQHGSSTRLDLAASLSDMQPRLEITELSDEELPVEEEHPLEQEPFHGGRRHSGNKIFEMASGLY